MKRVSEIVHGFFERVGLGMSGIRLDFPNDEQRDATLPVALEEQQQNLEARLYLLRLRADTIAGAAIAPECDDP